MRASRPGRPVLQAAAAALLGIAVSAFAFYGLHRQRAYPPFSEAVEFVAPEDDSTIASVAGGGRSYHRISSTDYLLRGRHDSFLGIRRRSADPDRARHVEILQILSGRFFGVTLRVLDPRSTLRWDQMLIRGRAPIAGKAEIAAGAGIEEDTVEIGRTSYDVVGRFRPEIAALRRSVVAYGSPALASDLAEATPPPYHSVLIEDPARWIEHPLEPSAAVRIVHSRPMGSLEFLLYVAGVMALYWGGSLLTWRLIQRLALENTPAVLREGFLFLTAHRRRFFILNGLYFGTATSLYLATYLLPDLQGFGWSLGQELVRSGHGTLGLVGEAYATRNAGYAASATLLVNLFIGTIRDITLPSAVLPGVGVVIGLLRAALWGVVLSPTTELIAHKFKVVSFLEGEGYVIAMVFAAQMFDALRGPRGTRLRRYADALVLNLKGLSIVTIMLALSAAVEVVVVLAFM